MTKRSHILLHLEASKDLVFKIGGCISGSIRADSSILRGALAAVRSNDGHILQVKPGRG